MDPLLKNLPESGLVNDYYGGRFLHANDVRTLATSGESLERQAALMKKFAAEN
jgi:hypothetical protein